MSSLVSPVSRFVKLRGFAPSPLPIEITFQSFSDSSAFMPEIMQMGMRAEFSLLSNGQWLCKLHGANEEQAERLLARLAPASAFMRI